MTLARRQLKQTKAEQARALKQRVKAELARLRTEVAAAKKQKAAKLKSVGAHCRAQRKLISERAKRARQRLNQSIARTRERGRNVCSSARGDAQLSTLTAIEAAAARLEAELGEQRKLRAWARPASTRSTPGRANARERAQESDGEVLANIDDPGLRIVWEAVKHRVKPGGRRSRTEAFFEWAAEHPSEVYEIQEKDAIAHLAELERREKKLAGSMRKGTEAVRRALLEAVPF